MSQDHPDILSQLAEQGRRLHLARKLPDGDLSWEWIERVRDDFRAFLKARGMSQGVASRKLGKGYSGGVISGFLSMKSPDNYAEVGDVQRIARGINAFMETEARRAVAPKVAGFVETDVAKRMLTLIANVIELRAIGMITSDPGRGKTITMDAAKVNFPGSVLTRVMVGSRSPAGLARQLSSELKIAGPQTALDIQMKLIDKFKGTDRPLLIDEAHHLNPAALDFVRDLHDACGIPIVLAGTSEIEQTMTKSGLAQFTSRVALRYDVVEHLQDKRSRGLPLHTVEEILQMFRSDQVRLTSDGADTLMKLANLDGMGGFRLVKQVLFLSVKRSGGKAIDGALIRGVLAKLHGKKRGSAYFGKSFTPGRAAATA